MICWIVSFSGDSYCGVAMAAVQPWDLVDVDDGERIWDAGAPVADEHDNQRRPWDMESVATDDEPPDPHTDPFAAGNQFIEELLDVYLPSSISAEKFCSLCYWATKANMIGPASEYAKAPGGGSGTYKKILDGALGLRNVMDEYYELNIVGQHRLTPGKRVECVIPVRFVHEFVEDDFKSDEAFDSMCYKVEEAKSNNELPPCYFDHPVVLAHSDETVVPYGIYMDGLPYSNTDSVVAIWFVNLIIGSRNLVGLVRKRLFCQCGCLGWCTFFLIMQWLHSSIQYLADKVWPNARHDGKAWKLPSDAKRAQMASIAMRLRCCIIQFRCDWPELCDRLGLPNWRSVLRPCYCCNGHGQDLFETLGNSIDKLRWHENDDQEYFDACERCEIEVNVTEDVHRDICEHLFYDRGSARGINGRYISANFPGLGLQRFDRLEPSAALPDVGAFEALTLFPILVTFWRTARASLCTHRSPLWDRDLGLVPSRLICIDYLHALLLGHAKKWCGHAIWCLLMANIWGRTETYAAARVQGGVHAIKAELFYWYENRARTHPDQVLTRLGDLTVKMIGDRENYSFKAKGMETLGFCLFLVDMLEKFGNFLEPEIQHRLVESGQCMIRMLTVFKEGGINLETWERQAMMDAWSRHMVLIAPFDIYTPKSHAIYHMVFRSEYIGNPSYYAVLLDEGLNKDLKHCLRCCHQATFEASGMSKFGIWLRRWNKRR